MTDQDVRDFLERMAAEEPVPFLDAEPLTRRARRRAARTVIVGAVGVAATIAVLFASVTTIRTAPIPADDPSEELGIFAPAAGRIVYGNRDGIWAVDPTATADRAAQVQLTSDRATPLGWSRDGTELLIMRPHPRPDPGPPLGLLSILQADGSETPVTTDPMYLGGATISPDGSRVVFAGDRLYAVDADGGPAEVLLEGTAYDPTFSPDGTQIAYVTGGGDHTHHVWVMNADGSDAHEIVFNEWTAADGHVTGLAWSPAGDRIALGLGAIVYGAIYTFAPDGSDFTQVIPRGGWPYWSPDGSQIAYAILCLQDQGGDGCSLAIADADGSNVREFDFATSGPWHPGQRTATSPLPSDPTAPLEASNADLGIFAGLGGWIAYGDTGGIWAVDPAQSGDPEGRIQLTSERGDPLAWSRDGSELLVLREVPRGTDASPHRDLYMLDADGTWRRLTDANGGITGGSFSPDGTEVVYGVWRSSGNAIYVLDVERGTSRLVTDDVEIPYEPAFSPDGSQIAYFDGAGDHSNSLTVMKADGSDVRVLTGPDYGHIDELGWSPDGARLAFSLQGGGLFIVGADGSGLSELIPDGENPAWSPDGSRISFQRRAGTPFQEARNGETIEGVSCPCDLGPLEIVTLDGGDVQEFGYAGSGPWNPLDR